MTHGENGKNVDSDFGCDVLVVGAGPAGATATYYTALAGLGVTVLEEQYFPNSIF